MTALLAEGRVLVAEVAEFVEHQHDHADAVVVRALLHFAEVRHVRSVPEEELVDVVDGVEAELLAGDAGEVAGVHRALEHLDRVGAVEGPLEPGAVVAARAEDGFMKRPVGERQLEQRVSELSVRAGLGARPVQPAVRAAAPRRPASARNCRRVRAGVSMRDNDGGTAEYCGRWQGPPECPDERGGCGSGRDVSFVPCLCANVSTMPVTCSDRGAW